MQIFTQEKLPVLMSFKENYTSTEMQFKAIVY